MAYLLDTDVFVTARNRHYGHDFCPGFWEWIVLAHGANVVRSVERVATELRNGDDGLRDFAIAWGPMFFVPPHRRDTAALAKVSNWVQSQDWEPRAVHDFLRRADYYLIGQALASQHSVVTHEVPSKSKRKIKIPNVCAGLGVKCMDPFAMLRAEGMRLVLDPAVRRSLQEAGHHDPRSKGLTSLFAPTEGE